MSGGAHSYAIQKLIQVFDQPLIENSFRGIYVEYIVAHLLGEQWSMTENWSAYDMMHKDGCKLEVKQSAAAQSWKPVKTKSASSFSIRAAKEHWVEGRYETMTGRVADIYVFAHHGETNRKIADHRNLDQWKFFVLPKDKLPDGQKSISLAPLSRLARSVDACDLRQSVEILRREIGSALT